MFIDTIENIAYTIMMGIRGTTRGTRKKYSDRDSVEGVVY